MSSNSFATPVLWVPGMDLQEWSEKVDQMLVRACATPQWLQGQLHTDTFLDLLDQHGIDVYALGDDWESGWHHL